MRLHRKLSGLLKWSYRSGRAKTHADTLATIVTNAAKAILIRRSRRVLSPVQSYRECTIAPPRFPNRSKQQDMGIINMASGVSARSFYSVRVRPGVGVMESRPDPRRKGGCDQGVPRTFNQGSKAGPAICEPDDMADWTRHRLSSIKAAKHI